MNKMSITLDTITEQEDAFTKKLMKLIVESDFYQQFHQSEAELDRRNGSVTFVLKDTCFTMADNRLKVAVIKKADKLAKKLDTEFGTEKVDIRFIYDLDGHRIVFGKENYHRATTVKVHKKCGNGFLGDMAGKVIKLAEILDVLYHLVPKGAWPFRIEFTYVDSTNTVKKMSYLYEVRRIHITQHNYHARVINEASRLLSCIEDTVEYEGFQPNFARVKASDTGDEYEISL